MARKAASLPGAAPATSASLAGCCAPCGRGPGRRPCRRRARPAVQRRARRPVRPPPRSSGRARRGGRRPSLAGELVRSGAGEDQGEPGGGGERRGDEGTPLFFGPTRPRHRLGQDRRHDLGRRNGSRPSSRAITVTDWPDSSTTCSTAASSGPATIASSVENGATTPMHIRHAPQCCTLGVLTSVRWSRCVSGWSTVRRCSAPGSTLRRRNWSRRSGLSGSTASSSTSSTVSTARAAPPQLLRAARAAGCFGVVRTSHVSAHEIGAALDAGADGVLAPSVSSSVTPRRSSPRRTTRRSAAAAPPR